MSQHIFKTVYFPRERVRSGSSARVSLSFPTATGKNSVTKEFLTYVQGLSSKEFRLAIGDPFLEDLEHKAQEETRSVSNVCFHVLLKRFNDVIESSPDASNQLALFQNKTGQDNSEPKSDLGVTFRESLRQRVYGWYPYVEGFSATYTRDAILRNGKKPRTIYDPFGGAGTTQLAASTLGIPSFYSEINPFMAYVAETKVNSGKWASENYSLFSKLAEKYLSAISKGNLSKHSEGVSLEAYYEAFPERDFFEIQHVKELLAAKQIAIEIAGPHEEVRKIFLLACAANVVNASNMTRRADLRRRRADEYKNRVVNVSEYITDCLTRMIDDIPYLPTSMINTVKVSEDCREIPAAYSDSFEMAITSPPYLNGTNYFRNTKLELWYMDFIKSETELKDYRARAITAGINNVFGKQAINYTSKNIENIVSQLNETGGDKRIALLVQQYFSDMAGALASVHRCLVPSGNFLLDIGDSKFYGVHIPTDKILLQIAKEVGFNLVQHHVIARRHSRDKSELVQVELVMEKVRAASKTTGNGMKDSNITSKIDDFRRDIPYKKPPFNSRSWGNKLHSLCSYQGKLKPAMAHWLIKEFVPTGGSVLDPLGGVGTIPFEAALLGHEAVSNDMSPFASTVAAAKMNPPSIDDALFALKSFEERMKQISLEKADFEEANFGLNATVSEYYHPETLEEILKARKIFTSGDQFTTAEKFVWASLLHVLHGNRPYALSRTSHPITPFYPKGETIYKSLVEKTKNRILRALDDSLPSTFVKGDGFAGDFRDLPSKLTGRQFDTIITSPPFLGMRFDRPNWLRMWFCGWAESDFHNTSKDFLERQQVQSTNCYNDFFDVCNGLIKRNGLVIIHVGSGGRGDLLGDLKRLAKKHFVIIDEIDENVQAIEQHGIRDKGMTTVHHLLFLKPL